MTRERDILILGTDEAGYGPNLGPLLVGASCWRAPANEDATDDSASNPLLLFSAPSPDEFNDPPRWSPDRLNAALAPISGSRKSVFPLLDSKQLYGPSKSLAALERPFMLASALLGRDSESFAAIVRGLRSESSDAPPPWERDANLPAPVDSKTLKRPLEPDLQTVRDRLTTENVALLDLAARRVQPKEFNAILDRFGLKSALIADVTTSLIVETLLSALGRLRKTDRAAPEFALVLCDKLGGRDRYASILQERFCGASIRVLREGRDASVYRFTATEGRDRDGKPRPFPSPTTIEARFTARGEANAPTALASIVAKYLRELSMRLFNEYWRRVMAPKTLTPTAGYPVDALRFRDDVDDARRRLGVPDDVFWRRK